MKNQKLRAQVKSRFYYIFWGTATAAVVLGQLYVGSGYRAMAEELYYIGDFFEFVKKQLEIDSGIIES